MTTLIHTVLHKNWFVATNFCDQGLDCLKNDISEAIEDWFVASNIWDKDAFENLANFFHKE